jgi:probable F420-dependent oxidoreductase
MMAPMELHGIGVWSGALRYGDRTQADEAAAELEGLGYTAAWVPDVGGDVFGAVDALLAATSRLVIATGILNLWMHEAEETAARYHQLVGQHGPRFLVGIGVSHAPLIDRKAPGTYTKPLARMREYLDALDRAEHPLPVDARVLAALGPKMLELARERAGGAHPYLANPEHTRFARGVLGDGPLLAPEQPVVLETDPEAARQLARTHLATYLGLPNYVNNLFRLGLTEDDVRDGGSDRLVDSIVAWGDEGAIAARLQAHRDAGADHVCIQMITGDRSELPIEGWRRLSHAL